MAQLVSDGRAVPTRQVKAASAFLPPTAAAVTTSGKRPWTFVLLTISIGCLLLALLPASVSVHSPFQQDLVRARFILAMVGVGSFIGLVVPVLAEAMQ